MVLRKFVKKKKREGGGGVFFKNALTSTDPGSGEVIFGAWIGVPTTAWVGLAPVGVVATRNAGERALTLVAGCPENVTGVEDVNPLAADEHRVGDRRAR